MGLIEPIDELTDNTKASHPELMSYLEDLMRTLDYDMKGFLEVLYNTRTYQRAAFSDEVILGQPYHFAGPTLRRMSAEQVWDSIVNLLIEEPDSHMPRLLSDLEGIEKQKQIYESLEGRSMDDYVALIRETAKITGKSAAAQEALREKAFHARESGDTERYQNATRELRQVRSQSRREIAELAYHKVEKGADLETIQATFGMNDELLANVKTKAPGGRAQKGKRRKGLKNSVDMAAMKEMSRDERREFLTELKQEMQVWTKYASQMVRASELKSPAPRGHFLREFGQSDRELIENANSDASVPPGFGIAERPCLLDGFSSERRLGQGVEPGEINRREDSNDLSGHAIEKSYRIRKDPDEAGNRNECRRRNRKHPLGSFEHFTVFVCAVGDRLSFCPARIVFLR